MEISAEREIRRKERKLKKRRQTIITLTIIVILISVGVVSAQTQGYEIFYQGESLGYIQSAGIYEDAIGQIEARYQDYYGNDDIFIDQEVELKSCRVEDSLNVETCMTVLLEAGLKINTNGVLVLCDDQVVGMMASLDEAERLSDAYSRIYPNGDPLVLIRQTATLAETSDFQTVLNQIKAIK
ncbi:hypothetical protein Q5O24_10795 [Eubacteriaceae bacterium ES3]|nr:hypothetical protein Q5O24_10795 [Eubacteriaceae bacterium ES3]